MPAEVRAPRDGYIARMDTAGIGYAAMMLGAGRETKEDKLDYLAGILLKKKTGEAVRAGEVIAELRASDEALFKGAEQKFLDALVIEAGKPQPQPLIYARVTAEGVEYR